ncbi:PREDICTED: sodium/potassium/calcium exchanger 3-like, partial [Papilio polytes]|uniref:sodium/potassium/calcium exchanger 3-like n=1 Tax=Papilio polytes TaxID=76194 RepID=UPI0006762D7E
MPDIRRVVQMPVAPIVPDEESGTTRFRSKYRVASVVRTFAFFLIPLLYFLLDGRATQQGQRVYTIEDAGGEGVLASRRLLAVTGPGEEESEVSARGLRLNCTPPAILEFPSDGLTRMQRKSGLIVVHCALAIYCCLLLAAVCEDYFVPAIEILCARLQMS